MLHIYTGTDYDTIKQERDLLLASFRKKRPSAQEIIYRFDEDNLYQNLVSNLSSVGLFDSKSIINASGICENNEVKRYICDHSEEFISSENAFVLYEPSLTKRELDKLEKSGASIHQYNLRKSGTTTNLFYLADLLCSKNKPKLWLGIQQELGQGVSVEEIMGILMFQARALHLSNTRSQKESTLKAFVYNKCTKSNWSPIEAQKLHLNFIQIYHQSRRGGMKLEERLEQVILNL